MGVGAIALAPIHPRAALPGIEAPAAVSAVGLELTAFSDLLAALPDPVTPWVNVFTNAVTNAGVLGTAWLADPLPAGKQALTNLIGYGETTATALGGVATAAFDYLTTTAPQALQTAFQQLGDGQPSAAASTLTDAFVGFVLAVGFPLFPVVAIPAQITDNLTAVVHAVTDVSTLVNLLIGAIGPVGGVIRAVGDSAQDFVDAVGTANYSAAVQAVFDVAPRVVGAIINGYTTTDGSLYPGLLTPPDENGANAGLAYTLLVTIPRAIGTALGATAPSSAALPVAAGASAAVAPPTSTEAEDTPESTGQAGSKETTNSGGSATPGDQSEPAKITQGGNGSSRSGTGGFRPSGKVPAKSSEAAASPAGSGVPDGGDAAKGSGAKKAAGAKSARSRSDAGNDGAGGAAE
ncbi:hypothetical protein [Mycobacterium sp. DL592]|uniref:hypothetical protein n=1 Tax=Mycobacterium sp. DL592 TaxID=2675524 RepID=UPI00142484F6|nr:hypothetical protein [Mycobacterium sp. DL592]